MIVERDKKTIGASRRDVLLASGLVVASSALLSTASIDVAQANTINRFSVGTKNKDLRLGSDGSLTIFVQADAPVDVVQRANWLPAPKGDFSLYVRAYWPKAGILDGSWTPPPVQRAN